MVNTDIPASTPVLELSRTPNSLGLVIGEQARVHLSNGFRALDVRTTPTSKSPLIDQLDGGEIVAILDGPVQGTDNNTWIKIRTPEGTDGWALAILTNTRSLDPATATPVG